MAAFGYDLAAAAAAAAGGGGGGGNLAAGLAGLQVQVHAGARGTVESRQPSSQMPESWVSNGPEGQQASKSVQRPAGWSR
eukprot:CAMPEP_0202393658 /NCGR_PEP_ID=MMETSP1127-20130417/93025_1 /ASSEMBLY_ACC=CAM_ASM_000462 /TAXON_ID=3047 /ORGANISM="Dunaliella tertiolecta, Strain CCMP1320" /LENGTH=79 /DNA_ID=CAMNT_0048996247 /DNA_START=880 /DNA_END=1120 /DNA_ORIENTATION=+